MKILNILWFYNKKLILIIIILNLEKIIIRGIYFIFSLNCFWKVIIKFK